MPGSVARNLGELAPDRSLVPGSQLWCLRSAPECARFEGDEFLLSGAPELPRLCFCRVEMVSWSPPEVGWLESLGPGLEAAESLELHLEGRPWARLEPAPAWIEQWEVFRACGIAPTGSQERVQLDLNRRALGKLVQFWRSSHGHDIGLSAFFVDGQWLPWSQCQLEYRSNLQLHVLSGDWQPAKASKRSELAIRVRLLSSAGAEWGCWRADHSSPDLWKLVEGFDTAKGEAELFRDLVDELELRERARDGGTLERSCQQLARRGCARGNLPGRTSLARSLSAPPPLGSTRSGLRLET